MQVEIHLNFYDTNDNLIGHKEKKYAGENPVKNGYKWAQDIFQSYATDINKVAVDVYENGEVIESHEYRVDTFLRDDLYCNLQRIIDNYDSSDESSSFQHVVTLFKHELKRYAKDKVWLEKK